MDQTPAHEAHNQEVLELIPEHSARLIEIGCSTGALAREFKKVNPSAHYLGIDIVEPYVALARRHCDEALTLDIEQADEAFFESCRDRDCWIFADSLEHLRDPWRVLAKVRKAIPATGSVVACLPNAQNWLLIAKLCLGDFRYEDHGLLDRTHLRWFTRKTMIELFQDAGFRVVEVVPRVFDLGPMDHYLPLIGEFSKVAGLDPRVAMGDAVPLQYVMRAEPA